MSIKYETLGKFKSKNGGDVYYVKRNLDTGKLSCNCKGWIYLRHCKHVDYMILNPCIQLTDIPTHQEAIRMNWGRNLEEKEKWTVKHLRTIEL